MSIHHIECAANLELPPSRKLVFMAVCDSADKDTGLGFPGFDTLQRWSGLGRSQVAQNLKDLIDDGYLERVSAGRRGRRAVFRVFASVACCVMHDPTAGSGTPDANFQTPQSATPDPISAIGSGKGSGIGSGLDRTPSQYPSSKPAAAAAASTLDEHLATLREAFHDHPALSAISFTMAEPQRAKLADLVRVHGVDRLVQTAVATKSNRIRRVSAFFEVWSELRAPRLRREVPALENCGICNQPKHVCDAYRQTNPDYCTGDTA